MDTKAIIKMSRCVSRLRMNVGINNELLRAVCQTLDIDGHCRINPSDVIAYLMYKQLIDNSEGDFLIKRIYSENLGYLKGAKKYEDVSKAYKAHNEIVEQFLYKGEN